MSRVRAKPRLPDKRKGLRSENRLKAFIEACLVVPNSLGRSASARRDPVCYLQGVDRRGQRKRDGRLLKNP